MACKRIGRQQLISMMPTKIEVVAIIVPIYKNHLSNYEEISLRRCFEVFTDPIIAIAPKTLDINSITSKYSFSAVERFEDGYFNSISGYNNLMTASTFYERFLNYKYILIYQLDAFVFKNDLEFWCSQNYDYIGAPWLWDLGKKNKLQQLKHKLVTSYHIYFNTRDKITGLPVDKQFRDKVGNGGFSLRNVSKFLQIINENSKMLKFYNSNCYKHHYFNEDAFWSIEVNRRTKKLNIPSYRVALNFSFENGLRKAYHLTNGNLPFGCHDWDNHLDFWRPHFKSLGYNI